MLVSKEQVIRKSGCYYLVGGMIRCNPHWEAFLTPPLPCHRQTPRPLFMEPWSRGAVLNLRVCLPHNTTVPID